MFSLCFLDSILPQDFSLSRYFFLVVYVLSMNIFISGSGKESRLFSAHVVYELPFLFCEWLWEGDFNVLGSYLDLTAKLHEVVESRF